MSRHTQPMTDAYMTGQRLRNAARAQCKIEQLGERWLLHPDNAVTRESHRQYRRDRIEVIDTRSVRGRIISRFSAFEGEFIQMCNRIATGPLLLQHEGGRSDPLASEIARLWGEQ